MDILLKGTKAEADETIERPGAKLLAPLWQTDKVPFGTQDTAKWENFTRWMPANGLLVSPVKAEDAFTNRFHGSNEGRRNVRMTLTQELRHKYHDLWHRMVTHPFVVELGDGTLSVEKFRAYFLQDYIFVHDLVAMTAMGLAKASTFLAANQLHQFLAGILNPENDLFVRAFKELDVPEEVYAVANASSVTQAFGDFIVRTGLEGSFEDIVTVLYVTEGTYLDWGTRLLEAGQRPRNPVYREWIDIHGPQVLGAFVAWLGQHLDSADLGSQGPRIDRIFHTTLRYEYLFWEGAYYGSASWPD